MRAPQEAALVGAALPTVSTSEFEEVTRSLAVSRQKCEELDHRLSKATLETVQTHSEECPPDHPSPLSQLQRTPARTPANWQCPSLSCCCSLYPQEGCPLARYGREGQDKNANSFGVCVPGPVRSPRACTSSRTD